MIEAWGKNVFSWNIPLFSVMKGEMTYNDYLDYVIKQERDTRYDINRLDMLVSVYFPALAQLFATARRRLNDVNTVTMEHKRAYLKGRTRSTEFVGRLQDAQTSFEAALDDFKQALAEQINASSKQS